MSIKYPELQEYGKIIAEQLPSEGYYDFQTEYPYPIQWNEEPVHHIFMFFYDINTDEKIIKEVEKFFKDNGMKYEVAYALHKNVSYLMAPWFSHPEARKIQKDKTQIVFKIDVSVDKIKKELQMQSDITKYNL